jgi:hypothetical protein
MEWTFGFEITVPLINLTIDDRREIFYTASNVGILYNYCTKKMVHFRGHVSTYCDKEPFKCYFSAK